MKKLLALLFVAFTALAAIATIPSRSAVAVTTASTEIFRQAIGGGGQNNISVTIQNPSTNTGSIEIAWDNVDNPLVSGTGQILAPGDWRTLKAMPVNSSGNVGVLGISLSGGTVNVRVMVAATSN